MGTMDWRDTDVKSLSSLHANSIYAFYTHITYSSSYFTRMLMKNTLINISENDFIATGLFSKCYRHPDIPDQCIKIKTDHKKANKRLKTDLASYKKLHARQTDLHYIADYLGTCTTNMGQGYVYQCVIDHDGEVSKEDIEV